jgi:hypothetical protein
MCKYLTSITVKSVSIFKMKAFLPKNQKFAVKSPALEEREGSSPCSQN